MKWFTAALALLPLASAQNTCFTNGTELRDAVTQYLNNPLEGTPITDKYGYPIASWCVGQVTDFTDLFVNAVTFNEDISKWDMSNATTIDGMFDRAAAFNQDISGWSKFRRKNLCDECYYLTSCYCEPRKRFVQSHQYDISI
jgi:hypothetical protein